MRRGDIVLVDLEPTRGSEANKRRPCVVVSSDRANDAVARYGVGMLTVVPLTSNVDHVRSYQVLVTAVQSGLDRDSKVQTEQIRSVSSERFRPAVIGQVPPSLMEQVDAALRLHLDL